MPWHTSGRDSFSPINAQSRKAYRGINTLCLWAAAQSKGYSSGEWATYQQWQDKGAQVQKGEKATTVVFWKFANSQSETDDDESRTGSHLLFTRGYSVFNAAQVSGYTPKGEPELPAMERIEAADAFFKAVGADVRHGGNRAYYTTSDDHIQMPEDRRFDAPLSYYSTLAHEHTHWTGAGSRLKREFGKRFGDMAYATEELVAELGAAFTLAHLGLSSEPREDHAQYIESWLKVLKGDKRAIFTAASKAQAAADFMAARQAKSSVEEAA